MSDDTPSPPLTLDELRETLERLGDLSLDLNDRIEEQTKAVKHATTMTNEARRATEATKQQTDPKRYGELVGATIDGKINDNLVRMGQMCVDLLQASNRARDVLAKAEEDKSIAQRQLWEREQRLDQWKSRWPLFGLAALVLALVMTLTLPSALATTRFTCELMVAHNWTTTTTGTDICVRYNE
ncbi:MAG: hypothetical protein AAFS03_05810 [Pseudomonadota bacterium]